MSRPLVVLLIVMLLCPVALCVAQGRRPGDRTGPSQDGSRQQPPATVRSDSHSTSPAPYTRSDNNNGGPSYRSPGGGGHPSGGVVSDQPYRRDGGHDDRYSYPNPNRAYGDADRRDWGGHRDYYGGGSPWYGGWGWGPSWGFSFGYGYLDPYPTQVVVPVLPYAVPGPTVYYSAPTVETVPPVYATPAPATQAAPPAPQDLPLLGCDIVAGDGTFLGVIDQEYDSPQSVANHNSAFGNPTAKNSIWNPQSPYGSPTGQYSPWNPKAATPPMLSWHGAFKAYLTNNPAIQPAIAPETLPEVIKASPWR